MNRTAILWIQAIQKLPGYTGHLHAGKHIVSTPASNAMEGDESQTLVEQNEAEIEDKQLIIKDIDNGRTEEDLLADEDRSDVVAHTAEIMEEIERDNVEAVVCPRGRIRKRLRDNVPGHMMTQFRL